MYTPRPRRGVVFLVAIVALVVMLIIGVTFAGQAMQQLKTARRELNDLHALAMADAGVQYMRFAQKFSGPLLANAYNGDASIAIGTASIPYPNMMGIDESRLGFSTLTREKHGSLVNYLPLPNLGDGQRDQGGVWIFRMTVNENGNTGAAAATPLVGYQIIAKGYYRDSQRAVRAVLVPPPSAYTKTTTTETEEPGTPPPPPPRSPIFDYALFGDASLNLKGNPTVVGDVGSNGFIKIWGNSANFNGEADAGGVIDDKHNRIADNKEHANLGRFADMPILNLAEYYEYATRLNTATSDPTDTMGTVITGDFSPTSSEDFGTKNFIYVTGTLHISGNVTIPANMTIVAVNGIRVSGNVSAPKPADGSVGLVLITPSNIKVTGNPTIDAVIFARNVEVPVNADGVGNATIYGAVLADNVDGRGNYTIYYRRPASDVIIIPPPPPPPPDVTVTEETDGSALNRQWNIASWERL